MATEPLASEAMTGTDDGPSEKQMIEEARREMLSKVAPENAASGRINGVQETNLYESCDVRVFARARPIIPEDLGWNPLSDDADTKDRERLIEKLRRLAESQDMTEGRALPACCATATAGRMWVHEPVQNFKGKRKIQNRKFGVDVAFGGETLNEEVYRVTSAPLVKLAAGGGTATIFAYGQTGTGKTFTMRAILESAAMDLFAAGGPHEEVYVAIIEILGSKLTDLTTRESVTLMEDMFGELQLRGAEERKVGSADELLDVARRALADRVTRATMRNATSSRSHACVKVRIHPTNPELLSAGVEDGYLFVVDLAGSESASDRSQHDALRMSEAKLINTSLMTLKDCIRSRGQISGFVDKHVHIPYRHSQLTLLLRDAFELAVRRPIKVAVIACVSPIVNDVKQTVNTLRYAQDLKSQPNNVVLESDAENPYLWSRQQAFDWLIKVSKGDVTPEDVLPEETDNGRVMAQIPEREFICRIMKSGKVSDKRAQKIYAAVWRRVADARTRQRKLVMRSRTKAAGRTKFDDFDEHAEELRQRIEEETEEEKAADKVRIQLILEKRR